MIRKMIESDRQNYFEMSRQFYSCGATLCEIDDSLREKFWNEILSDNSLKAYILEYGNETAGYALTVLYPSQEYGGNVLWIDELFVLPAFRGKGVAKEFFNFVSGLENKVMLRLEAEKDNERALKLYKSLGFEVLPYVQMIKKDTED